MCTRISLVRCANHKNGCNRWTDAGYCDLCEARQAAQEAEQEAAGMEGKGEARRQWQVTVDVRVETGRSVLGMELAARETQTRTVYGNEIDVGHTINDLTVSARGEAETSVAQWVREQEGGGDE